MKAIRFAGPDGEARIGVLEGETIRDAGPSGPQGFVPTAEAWAALEGASGPQVALSDVRVLPPVVPGKIAAIGLNYRSHAEESELDVPAVPVVFSKFPSSVIGHGEDIVIPREETRPDFEGELAVIIGRRTYRAEPADALAAIGGITALHDVSGRRAQLETPLRQFTLGKSFDTFTPMGPVIASLDGIDLTDIDVRTTISGEVMQDANTRDLIFPVAELDRLPVQGPDAGAGRRDRHRHARRGRRLARPAALPARGRRRGDRGRRRRHAAQRRAHGGVTGARRSDGGEQALERVLQVAARQRLGAPARRPPRRRA